MSVARENVEKLRDIVSVRAFGAKGDGSTNDTAAFIAAATSAAALKQMLFIPGGTYVVGNWTPPASLYVYGAGAANTVLRRPANAATNDAVVNLTQGDVTLENVAVDGNKANNSLASQCIAVTSGGNYTLRGLAIRNAKAVAGFGVGVALSSTNDETQLTQTIIEDCQITGNDSSGISIDECWNIRIEGCRSTQNGGSGISVANFDSPIEPASQRNIIIVNNFCPDNTETGIQVAGTTVTNILPTPGNQQPYNIIVQGNECRDNGSYGIACQGTGINCTGNQCFLNGNNDPVAAGILFNCYFSICSNNICVANVFFGIDAGGCYESAICDNICSFNGNASATPTGIGINVGGSVSVSCDDNTLVNNGGIGAETGIQIYCAAYEYGAGGGTPFRTSAVSISNNMISMAANTQVGIEVRQGGDALTIHGNLIRGSTANNAIQLATDSYDLANNIFAGSVGTETIASASTIIISDWAETVTITGTTAITGGINTYSQNAYDQKVAWVEVTNGGSGYTSAPTVSFSGGGGSNAAATAYIDISGKVSGVLLTNYGSGYTSAPTVSFSGGGGSGAAATAQVGVPNRIGRKLTLVFGDASSVANAGGNVFLSGQKDFFAASGGQDTLSLIGMYGTNWQEIGRQSAISEAYSNTASAADIAAIGNVINTRGKYAGRAVYDTTNNRLMIASGSNANSTWYRADSGANVTPS